MDTRSDLQMLLFAALAVSAAAFPATGHAQSPASETFEPQAVSSTSIWSTATSDVPAHLTPTVGLTMHWADDPVTLRRQSDGALLARLVDNQFKGDLGLGLGLFDRVELGVVLPVVMYQDGAGAAALPGAETTTVGETRIQARVHLLEAGGFGLGAQGVAYLPVPANSPYQTNQKVSGLGSVVADYAAGGSVPWRIAANIGWAIAPSRDSDLLASDDRLDWRLAGEVQVLPRRVHLMATVFGQWEALADAADPVGGEYLGGARVFWGDTGLTSTVGAGGGFGGRYGTPDVRVVASLSYRPSGPSEPSDTDGDGLVDAEDGCREAAEDQDGFEDGDGCPDPDNDGDAIADAEDRCPDTSGVAANEGCPEQDSDGDGLVDRADACAETPEDADGFEDEDGCPDPDNDGDAIADAEDNCPDTAGVEANAGCPDADADGDGMVDREDGCVDEAEDEDGYEDEDGCPDPDNDGDGVADAQDQCPDRPETVNGNEDEDGCPDESKVKVVAQKIEFSEKVYFASNKATIKQRSYGLLEEVVRLLESYPQITKVRVEGHTDSRGGAAYNKALSQRRAESVRAFLIERGIDGTRLEAVGYGEEQSLESNDTESGRAANRRVELEIVEVDGAPVDEDGPVELK